MEGILNGIFGQEGNIMGAKAKDTFFIFGFDIWSYLCYRAYQINPSMKEGFTNNSVLVVIHVIRFKVHCSRSG